MRIQLAAAVALAPLMMASGAAAQVVISNERTTPITTSTANNGAPDSIRIANNGIIRISSGTAVTVDSSNDLTIDAGGRITMADAADGATAVLVEGGNTADISHNGIINISDNFEGTDTDSDGDLDGVYATGTGRFGIRVVGPGALTGDISTGANSQISVDGNQSAGISIETDLIGDFTGLGLVSITGTDSYGIRVTGDIDGDYRGYGSVSARGEGTVGVSLEGDISGSVVFGGAIQATGFRYTGNLTQAQIDALDEDDLLTGGPAVSIAGDVAGGVLFAQNYSGDPNDTDDDDDGILDADDTDDDGNGIPDASETRANIVSFGSAPAVQIGSADRAIVLGAVGVDDEAYGLINRGVIGADGIFEGFSATAMRIGLDGGQAVTITGGIRNEGDINASAREADARAVLIGSTADIGRIDNFGSIRATVSGDDLIEAVGLEIEAGAVLNSLVNRSGISAAVSGEAGSAYAIRDASGTLTSVTNNGAIVAQVSPTDNADDDDDDNTDAGDEEVTGRAVAIDVSANTTGVTIIQDGIEDGDDGDDDIADPDADGDGVDDNQEPLIIGDILLGSGDDVLDVRNGIVDGDIEFGVGQDSLLIDGGGEVRGALTDTDGLLDIAVTNGVLDARQPSSLTISNLDVGAAISSSRSTRRTEPPAGSTSRVRRTSRPAPGLACGSRPCLATRPASSSSRRPT